MLIFGFNTNRLRSGTRKLTAPVVLPLVQEAHLNHIEKEILHTDDRISLNQEMLDAYLVKVTVRHLLDLCCGQLYLPGRSSRPLRNSLVLPVRPVRLLCMALITWLPGLRFS